MADSERRVDRVRELAGTQERLRLRTGFVAKQPSRCISRSFFFFRKIIRQLDVDSDVLQFAPRARMTGKVGLDCPECGIAFERYACWVKRKKVCYCSKACADEGKRRPVEVQCVVCAATFISTPSETSRGRVATCSDACMRANRSELTRRGVLLPEGHRAGREQGNGKLTPLQAHEIANSTESTCVLVARYDVSATTVRNIRRAHRRANSNTPNV